MHNYTQPPTLAELEAQLHLWRNCYDNARREEFKKRFGSLLRNTEKQLQQCKKTALPRKP